MDKLLDKLSSYNILNNLIPGSIFCYLVQYINDIDLLTDSVVENLFVYYFAGMVISRLGSLIVEPFAKRIGIINYADYNDYLSASKADVKIDPLLETNNLYRTISAGSLLIIVASIYLFAEQKICLLSNVTPYIVVVLLLLLFLLSYRKQTDYIRKRVEYAVRTEQEGNVE